MMRKMKKHIFSSEKKRKQGEDYQEDDEAEKEDEENNAGEEEEKTPMKLLSSSKKTKTDFAGRIGGVFNTTKGRRRSSAGAFFPSSSTKKTKNSEEEQKNNIENDENDENEKTTVPPKLMSMTTGEKKYVSGKDFLTASAKKKMMKKKSDGESSFSMGFKRPLLGLSSPPSLGPPSCLISPNGGANFIVTHKSPNSVAFEMHPGGREYDEDGEDAPPSAHYLSGSPVASGKIFERKEKKTSLSPLAGKIRQFPSLGGAEGEGGENDRGDHKEEKRENDTAAAATTTTTITTTTTTTDAVAEKKGDDDHRGAPVVSSPSVSISDGEENVDGRSEGNAKRGEEKEKDLVVDVNVEEEREIVDDDEEHAVQTWLRDQKILRESGQSMNEDHLKAAPKRVMEALGISDNDDGDDGMIVNDAPVDYGSYDDDDHHHNDDNDDNDFGGNYVNGDDDDMIEEEEREEDDEQLQQQEQDVFEGSKAKSDYAYQCSKCNQNFLSRYKHKLHLSGPCGKIEEKSTMNSNECSKCGKVCKNQQGRIRHEQACPGKEELERRAREEADRKAEELQRRAEKAEEKRRAKEEEERTKEAKREEARKVEEQKKSEMNRRERETKDRAAAVKKTLAEARLFEALQTNRGMTPAAAIVRVIREKLLKATTRAAMIDDEDCSDNDATEKYSTARNIVDSDALTASMRRTRDDLVKQLEPTVTGHEDSIAVCLSGARGVGKTAIVEAALAKLQKLNNNTTTTMSNRRKPGNQQHKEAKIPVVRLSGLLHAEDNIGMREVARQLRPSYQMWDDEEMDDDEVFDNDFVDDIVFSINTAGGTANNASATNKVASNMRENYNFVEETLRLLEGAKKTAVFVLDDFDLFARKGKKQTFLYSMLDLLQQKHAQIAIIAITSRHDVEEALEKRVKSRFTARYCVVESQTCIPPLVLDERTGQPLKDRATGKEIVDDESISRNLAQFEEFLAERVRNCLKVSAQIVPPLTEKRDIGVAESSSAIPGVLFSERGKLAIKSWNAAVDEAINTPLVKTRLQAIATLDNVPRTASDLAIAALMAYQSRTLFSTAALLNDNNGNDNNISRNVLLPSDLARALKDFTRNDFVENLKSCSLLELLLCVAAYRLHFTRERFHFTIAALTQELHEMGSVEQLGAAKDATDGVVARSFETLLRMKLVRIVKRSSGHGSSYSSAAAATAPSANGNNKRAPTNGTASGAKDWKGVALMCTEKELIEAIEGHPSKLSSLKEFLRHENVASAVACAL